LSWDVIKQMCTLLPCDSSHETLSFHSVFHPAPFFKFFSIFRRAGCSALSAPMFDASAEILAPMFQVAGANTDVPELEACLGSNYLHGMTMLAELASCSLQKKLAARRADASIRVKVTFDRLATGMSATVVADDKFIGRKAEMDRINRCACRRISRTAAATFHLSRPRLCDFTALQRHRGLQSLSTTWATCFMTAKVLRRTEQRPSDGTASPPHRGMHSLISAWHDWARSCCAARSITEYISPRTSCGGSTLACTNKMHTGRRLVLVLCEPRDAVGWTNSNQLQLKF
jgi:hypothetical protein